MTIVTHRRPVPTSRQPALYRTSGRQAMKHFCVIIDTRRGYARLGRCLRAIATAVTNDQGSVDIILVADRVRSRLVTLADQHGASIIKLPAGPRGQRYNTIANSVQTEALVFIDATAEVPPGWFMHIEDALHDHWNAVILTTQSRFPPWLARFYHPAGRTLALAIKRTWFERVGGFDPDLDNEAERDLVGRLMACHARVLQLPPNGDPQHPS